jgi:prevent-host-death family protein
MATWQATKAKAQFSEVLDRAATEGPQLVRRRKQEFYVVTKEQLVSAGSQTPASEQKPFVSAWDALRPSSDELFDVDFPRLKSKPREIKF